MTFSPLDEQLITTLKQHQSDSDILIQTVNHLIAQGANINALVKKNKPLNQAATQGLVRVVELLINKGADVNAGVTLQSLKRKKTALHRAALNNHIKVVETLLKAGADPNLCNSAGDSPFHQAIKRGNYEIVELLLQQGALPYPQGINHSERQKHSVMFQEVDLGSAMVIVQYIESGELLAILLEKALCLNEETYILRLLERAQAIQSEISIVREAVKAGYYGAVNCLLNKLSVSNSLTRELLRIAVTKGYSEIVERLLQHNPSMLNDTAQGKNSSLLYHALCSEQLDIVELLLKKGARLYGFNLREKKNLLKRAILENRLFLSEQLCDSLVLFGVDGSLDFLEQAAGKGYLDIMKLLLQNNVSVNGCLDNLPSPLYEASKNGHVKAVELLLQQGASLNSLYQGQTALSVALQKEQLDVAKLLVQSGADVNQLCWGIVPLGVAEYSEKPYLYSLSHKKVSALHYAVALGQLEMVKYLLQNGAWVNQPIDENYLISDESFWSTTPLHCAAEQNNLPILKLLTDEKYQVDVNARDLYNEVPLSVAMHFLGQKKAVCQTIDLLIDKGANIDVQIGPKQETCLHRATHHMLWMKRFVEKGAMVDARDLDGKTPLDRLLSLANKEKARYLLQNGADRKTLTVTLYNIFQSDSWDMLRKAKFLMELGVDIGPVEVQKPLLDCLIAESDVLQPEIDWFWRQALLAGLKTRLGAQDAAYSIQDDGQRNSVLLMRARLESLTGDFLGKFRQLKPKPSLISQLKKEPSMILRLLFYSFNYLEFFKQIFEEKTKATGSHALFFLLREYLPDEITFMIQKYTTQKELIDAFIEEADPIFGRDVWTEQLFNFIYFNVWANNPDALQLYQESCTPLNVINFSRRFHA